MSNQVTVLWRGKPMAIGANQFKNLIEKHEPLTILSKDEFNEARYRVLYYEDGIKVERFNKGEIVGIEYRISDEKRCHAFTTSIMPVLDHNHLIQLITDDIEWKAEDMKEVDVDFTEYELIN